MILDPGIERFHPKHCEGGVVGLVSGFEPDCETEATWIDEAELATVRECEHEVGVIRFLFGGLAQH